MNEIVIDERGLPENTGIGISRESILNFEELLKANPGSEENVDDLCTFTHTFSEGVYVREMFAPQDSIIVGKIIKAPHHIFLMTGSIIILTEDGKKTLTGPTYFVAEGGTKRIGYTLTDVVWINVHPNPTNTEDVDKIEEHVISPSYEHYDELKESITKTLS